MGLESGAVIEDLQSEWPLGGDPTNQGDNHLRLIKNVLKLQFPGAEGNGFATPIIATEEEINWLTGLSGNVQEQFDALSGRVDDLEGVLNAPQGTALLFYQSAAPLGWTQDDTMQDFMVRTVGASGGGSGGADSPIVNDKVPGHDHPLSGGSTVANGSHTHTLSVDAGALEAFTFDSTGNAHGVARFGGGSAAVADAGGDHTHMLQGSCGDNSGASDWRPKYINTIIAVKD